jgi:hypothetical protein
MKKRIDDLEIKGVRSGQPERSIAAQARHSRPGKRCWLCRVFAGLSFCVVPDV